MKKTDEQLKAIFAFLQEAVTKEYDIEEVRKKLKQTSVPVPDKPDWIYESGFWMLPCAKGDIYQIPEELRCSWNLFIQKMLSPIAKYRYQSERSCREDLIRLHAGFCAMQEKGNSHRKTDYYLENRTLMVSDRFVGRESLLDQIHHTLNFDSRILVLHGLAGIGKSELAKAYANRYASDYQTIVFCHFHDNLQETMIDDCQISVKNLSFQSTGKRGERGWYFRRKLSILGNIMDENTLLVIDNFDVLTDERLRAVISLPCKILFTSRTDPSVFSLPGIRILELPLEIQREMFFAYCQKELLPEEHLQLDRLLFFLNGHTLSIKLCASYLAESTETIAELLQCLQNDEAFSGSEIQTQIQSIFRVADLGKEERAILRFLSVMPLYGISLEKFMEWCHIKDVSRIKKMINRGLIEWSQQNRQLSLHPLIIRAIRQTETVSFQTCSPYTQTMCMLSHQTWRKTLDEMKEYEKYLYTFTLSLVNTKKEPFEELTYVVSGCWQFGYFTLAERLALSMHHYSQKKYGDDSTQTAVIRYRIGELYDNCGKRKQAIKWYSDAYREYANSKTIHPFYYAIICHKYGKALHFEEKYEASERILLFAQDYLYHEIEKNPQAMNVGYEQDMGVGALFDIYMELAVLYIKWGKPESALHWIDQREQRARTECPYLLQRTSQWFSDYNRALCQMELGNLDDAEKSLQHSLSIAKKYFIDESPFTCMILNAFGELMTKKGNVHAAEEWFHRKRMLEKKQIN